MWRKVFALLFGFLILGMTFSTASAAASVVEPINVQPSGVIEIPPGVNPGVKPGDEVRPQFWWIIGLIILDFAAHWFLEHYVSSDVATLYDAITMLIDPAKVAEKAGIKGAELGIKVISREKVLIGLFKDSKVVKKITYASKDLAEWVSDKLGKDYLKEIAEKYLVRNGEPTGKDFDKIVRTFQKLENLGIKSAILQKIIIQKGWDVEKFERVISDIKGVSGGDKLFTKIKNGIRKGFEKGKFVLLNIDLGPLYEAEVVSHLKRSGWGVAEVEKEIRDASGKTLTEIDIIAEHNGEMVYIECKRSYGGIKPGQIVKQAEYAKSQGVRKIYVYYSKDVYSPRQHYDVMRAIREARSKFGVDVGVVWLSSEFN